MQPLLEHILIAREGRKLTVSLNRPHALNAITMPMHHEIGEVLAWAARDEESDLIILTGSGRAFSAGGDINDAEGGVDMDLPDHIRLASARLLFNAMMDCAKPIIARVNGDAIGLGATLALLSDIIIAVDTARFADPHVKVGLTAGDGGALIWPQLIGFARAKQYLLTGDMVDAVTAERIGLINFAVPASELDTVVDKYAGKLLNGAQQAIRYTKLATNLALKTLGNSVFETSLAYELLTGHTADHRERLENFRERRRQTMATKVAPPKAG